MSARQLASRLATRLTAILKVDVRFYGRSMSWISIAYATAVVRGVSTTFLLARRLTPTDLGQFRYLLALFSLASIFSLSGLQSGIVRGVAKGDTVIVRDTVRILLTYTPLGALFLWGFAAYLAWHQEPTIAACVAIAGVAFPFYALSGLFGSILNGLERIQTLAKTSIVNNLSFAFLFVATTFLTRDLIWITAAYFGFDILFRGFMTLHLYRSLEMKGESRSHKELGNHLTAIGVFQTITGQLDQLLVQWVGGYSGLAGYSIAMLLPEQIKDLFGNMSNIVLRRFSQQAANEKTLLATRRHFWTVICLTAVIILAYAVCTPLLLPLLFPNYRNQVWPSVLYATGLFGMASVVGTSYFQAHHQLKKLWRFYTANSLLQLSTNLLLIPWFGAWGAIVAKTATRLASLPFSYPARTTEPAADTPPSSSA
jgi:O-antigen/teichoic acid export membrane protein